MPKNNSMRLDFLFKMSAFFGAILLWLLVIHIENPMYSTSIKNHPVSIFNTDKISEEGYSIKNKEELSKLNTKISIKGPRLKVESILDNPELLNAAIDLSNITLDKNLDEQTVYLNISVSTSISGITIESIKSKSVEITVEKIISKEFPIELNTSLEETGEYLTLTPILSQDTVTLTGPISSINNVSNVVANTTIDISSEKSISIDAPLVAMDSDGNACTDVTLSTNLVNVILPIGKKKEVPLNVAVDKSSISSNVSVIDISLEPSVITIVGEADLIDSITCIDLNEISLSGIYEDVIMNSFINLPEGVTRIDSRSNYINVNLKIERHQSFESKITLKNAKLNIIGISDPDKYKVLTKQITIPFYAAPSVCEKVDINTFEFSLYLSNLQKGVYTVSAQITSNLPVKLISDTTYIQIEIF